MNTKYKYMKVSNLRDLIKKENIPIPEKGSGVGNRIIRFDLISAIKAFKETKTKVKVSVDEPNIKFEGGKKKIFNKKTNRWMLYGGQAFKKKVREGDFDDVIPKEELIRLKARSPRGRPKSSKKRPKRITKTPSKLDKINLTNMKVSQLRVLVQKEDIPMPIHGSGASGNYIKNDYIEAILKSYKRHLPVRLLHKEKTKTLGIVSLKDNPKEYIKRGYFKCLDNIIVSI